MDTQRPAKRLDESTLFAENKLKITKDVKLLDDILNGVTFLIACKPDEFPFVDQYGTRTAKTEQVKHIPSLSIFFNEYDDHIALIDIQVAPDEIPF